MDVHFSGNRPPEVVLPPEDEGLMAALSEGGRDPLSRERIAALVTKNPTSLFAWAVYGSVARDDLESYMAYRIGYHRGLDALRQHGWRGSGYVRWNVHTNRGFLRCLLGLARASALIGETAEADRCRTFLAQLDPTTAWETVD
jgi:hypothetical protein